MSTKPSVPAARPQNLIARRSGSILLMLVVGLFVFMAAYALIAAGQVVHARRLGAEYGRLQAVYAAESAIFAAIDARTHVPVTTLWAEGQNLVTYSATMDDSSAPTWITGYGTARVRGDTVTAHVRGYSTGRRVVLWDFSP